MIIDNELWPDHDGSDACPCPPSTRMRVATGSGWRSDWAASAGGFRWRWMHDGKADDIIAYKIEEE